MNEGFIIKKFDKVTELIPDKSEPAKRFDVMFDLMALNVDQEVSYKTKSKQRIKAINVAMRMTPGEYVGRKNAAGTHYVVYKRK